MPSLETSLFDRLTGAAAYARRGPLQKMMENKVLGGSLSLLTG